MTCLLQSWCCLKQVGGVTREAALETFVVQARWLDERLFG